MPSGGRLINRHPSQGIILTMSKYIHIEYNFHVTTVIGTEPPTDILHVSASPKHNCAHILTVSAWTYTVHPYILHPYIGLQRNQKKYGSTDTVEASIINNIQKLTNFYILEQYYNVKWQYSQFLYLQKRQRPPYCPVCNLPLEQVDLFTNRSRNL